MRSSCKSCPKRLTCTSICKKIEKQLPRLEERGRADLSVIDREVVWIIQDRIDELPTHLAQVAERYYRDGWKEADIAVEHAVSQRRVSAILAEIRERMGL